MQELNADAYGVAALSIIAAVVFKLIDSEVMTKEEVLELYGTIAQAKLAKGKLYGSAAERDASILVETMRMEIETRHPDK